MMELPKAHITPSLESLPKDLRARASMIISLKFRLFPSASSTTFGMTSGFSASQDYSPADLQSISSIKARFNAEWRKATAKIAGLYINPGSTTTLHVYIRSATNTKTTAVQTGQYLSKHEALEVLRKAAYSAYERMCLDQATTHPQMELLIYQGIY